MLDKTASIRTIYIVHKVLAPCIDRFYVGVMPETIARHLDFIIIQFILRGVILLDRTE